MILTTAQLQAIKADIAANGDLSAFPNTSDGNDAIANLYNAAAAGPFVVWRSAVPIADIMANGFVWNEIDALTAGKARIWDWMAKLGVVNPSKPNVRQGLRDCFGVSSGTYVGLLPHCKRSASRIEKLLAAGTGSDATPATMGAEGPISYQEIESARSSA